MDSSLSIFILVSQSKKSVLHSLLKYLMPMWDHHGATYTLFDNFFESFEAYQKATHPKWYFIEILDYQFIPSYNQELKKLPSIKNIIWIMPFLWIYNALVEEKLLHDYQFIFCREGLQEVQPDNYYQDWASAIMHWMQLPCSTDKVVWLAKTLRHSHERYEVLATLEHMLDARQMGIRNIQALLSAVDEVLLNAVFDAPTEIIEGAVHQKYRLTDRSDLVPLEGRHRVTVDAWLENDLIHIRVIDLFGSLDKKTVFDHFNFFYKKTGYVVDDTKKNASLGLYQLIYKGISVQIVSESERQTEVILLYSLQDKTHKNMLQFLLLR